MLCNVVELPFRKKEATMSAGLPVTYLARHGESALSLSGQHAELTDLPLDALCSHRMLGKVSALAQ